MVKLCYSSPSWKQKKWWIIIFASLQSLIYWLEFERVVKQRQQASQLWQTHLFIPAHISASFSHSCYLLTLKCVTCLFWPRVAAWPLNPVARALGNSHLAGLVLTRRLLVELIAICIALLVSQLCLGDISVLSPRFFPFLAPSLRLCLLFVTFWGEELDTVWCVIKYSCLK